MARLPISRIAGIAAWSAASVAWGTTAVAVANHTTQPANTEPAEAAPVVAADPQPIVEQAPVPTMPEGGLVVLRYTPSEAPRAETIIRRVVVASPSGGGSAPAAAAPAASAPAPPPPATTQSSGS
jgi:hypothetical protein